MVIQRESRRLQRTRFTAEQHFDALDADVDDVEGQMAALKTDIAGVRAVLTGLMVSIALAAVALAANLALHAL